MSTDENGLPMQPPHGRGLSDADLELMALAARAIGAVRVEVFEGENWVNLHFADRPAVYNWNPLMHSDDAFNLSVRLKLNIYHDSSLVDVHGEVSGRDVYATEECGQDPDIATRRAVTRAAAEIGKQPS